MLTMELIEQTGEFTADGVRVHRASVQPRDGHWARVIVFHGYGDHSGRYLHVMRWLASRGIACHAFDARGHGRSSGRRGYVRDWNEFLADASSALQEEARLVGGSAPRFLLGHSHGGLVLAAGVIRRAISADGIILSAPYLQSGVPVTRRRLAMGRAVGLFVPWMRFRSRLPESWISSDQEMLAEFRHDPLMLRTATPRWYMQTLAAQKDTRHCAGEFALPLLCLVGDADRIALPAASVQFYESARSPVKRLRRFPGMLHELLREKGREQVFEEIVGWVRSRVDQPGTGAAIALGSSDAPS